MKTLKTWFGLFFIGMSLSLQAQIKTEKTIKIEKKIEAKKVKILPQPKKTLKLSDIYGSYTIESYYAVQKKHLKKRALKSLLGSDIQVDDTHIFGSQLNDIPFQYFELMTIERDDFLYRSFEQLPDEEIKELPHQLTLFKSDTFGFLGIILLPEGKIAFTYQGGVIIAKAKP